MTSAIPSSNHSGDSSSDHPRDHSSIDLSSLKPITVTLDQWSNCNISFHPYYHYMLIHKKLPGFNKVEDNLRIFASKNNIEYFPTWIKEENVNIFFPFRMDTIINADGSEQKVPSTEVFVVVDGSFMKLDIKNKRDFIRQCPVSTAYTIEFIFVPEIKAPRPCEDKKLCLKCVKVVLYYWGKE